MVLDCKRSHPHHLVQLVGRMAISGLLFNTDPYDSDDLQFYIQITKGARYHKEKSLRVSIRAILAPSSVEITCKDSKLKRVRFESAITRTAMDGEGTIPDSIDWILLNCILKHHTLLRLPAHRLIIRHNLVFTGVRSQFTALSLHASNQ